MLYFIVWNESKTEGFITTDEQLAYEVRKSAYSNCVDKEGRHSPVAEAFCDYWYEDNCSIQQYEDEK